MKSRGSLVLVGAVVLALGAGTLAVAAVKKNLHTLTVRLPDGSVETIRYLGDTPPAVGFAPSPLSPIAIVQPFGVSPSADAAFGRLEQLSTQMDAQADAMMRDLATRSMPAGVDGLKGASLGPATSDARIFTVTSSLGGSGMCVRSMRYTATNDDKPPQVVSHTYGDCAGQDRAARTLSAPQASHPNGLTQTSYPGALPAERGGQWE